jgi:Cu+-exporting ATPase
MARFPNLECIFCQLNNQRGGIALAMEDEMSHGKAHSENQFLYLDQEDFKSKYTSEQNAGRIRFYVEGASCGKCVRKIEELSLNVAGLKSLRFDLGTGLAEAEIDPRQLAFSSLAEKIRALGYNPIPLTPETASESLQKIEDRRELIRLGVGAACAGNIMTFSFATYLGAPREFSDLFQALSFTLYLPVLFYVALPFYFGALRSLRLKQISIDLPLAIASLSGFAFSTIQWLRGYDDIYFDSLSGFVFLILLSRAIQKRMQRKFLRPQELLESLRLERVRRVSRTGWDWTPIESLRAGERVLLLSPETLPAECELLSSRAHFSLAWLSGESRPKTFLRGSTVPAGARLLSGEAHLVARKPLRETGFGQILSEVQSFSLSNNRMVSISDRWAQWLLGLVLTSALVFLASYWFVSSEEAIRRSLALIILACPCAMAFGTPLALAAALRRAQKSGLIVRNADIFEKCVGVDTVFFDKTGTLTESDLALVSPPQPIPGVYQKVVLALENESMHPIAFSFRQAFGSHTQLPPVDGLTEKPGFGVSGFIYGKFYEIRKNTKPNSQVSCTLFEDQHPIQTFVFQARLKPGVHETLQAIRALGKRVILLSGDTREVSQVVGKMLGFRRQDILAEMDPAGKLAAVTENPRSMMVGDGVNDSLAMMRSQVGVAVSGGMQTALRSADVYLSEESLDGITKLFAISARCMRTIKTNLFISVFYNAVGGGLALLGVIDPLAAALLMPLSSGFILLSTWISTRNS